MELYVNPQITGFRQEVDGTIKELKIGSNKEDAYENIIEQGGKKLDNNKAVTINVSTYTEPVVVTPTSGKDGMKKATITLSNIPSPSGVTKLYCYKDSEDGYMGVGEGFCYDFYSTSEITQTGTYLVIFGYTTGGDDNSLIGNTTISVTVANETITFVDTREQSHTLVKNTSKDVTLS